MWETPATSSYVVTRQAILERNKVRLRDVARITVIAILRAVVTNISTYLSAMHSRARRGHEKNKQRLPMSDLRHKY